MKREHRYEIEAELAHEDRQVARQKTLKRERDKRIKQQNDMLQWYRLTVREN